MKSLFLSFFNSKNILVFLLFFLGMILLFPLERVHRKLKKTYLEFFVSLLVFVLLIRFLGIAYLLRGAMVSFLLWVVIYTFNMRKDSIFTTSFIFLALTPVLLVIGFHKFAEISISFFFILLVVGVAKNLFYEKLFED